ncbi:MAG: T9SS type A sorting domain-containing protein, partial [Bacteroidales bacterium]|nr:T9SS type A sorting domain-containing protein [Bacteroidales bacterium]
KAEQNSYIDISIYDTKGVLVYKDKKEIVKGFNSLNINPFISSKALYFISVKSTNKTFTKKIIF